MKFWCMDGWWKCMFSCTTWMCKWAVCSGFEAWKLRLEWPIAYVWGISLRMLYSMGITEGVMVCWITVQVGLFTFYCLALSGIPTKIKCQHDWSWACLMTWALPECTVLLIHRGIEHRLCLRDGFWKVQNNIQFPIRCHEISFLLLLSLTM